jgi:protein-S-isoprenylcysteine O-methyltransferase Ste14
VEPDAADVAAESEGVGFATGSERDSGEVVLLNNCSSVDINIFTQNVESNLPWRNALHLSKRFDLGISSGFEWMDKEASSMRLLRAIWLPALVLTAVLASLSLDAYVGWRGPRISWLGGLLVLTGSILASWCAALFRRVGHGTPLPFVAKTTHLVIVGPYRLVRNPMMWAFGAILAGVALWLGSVGLWIGLAVFAVFILLFVHVYEERDMERRFGDEYRAYCRQVPPWWPRFRVLRRGRPCL